MIEHDEPDAHYWNWSIHQLHWFDSGAWDQRLMSCNGHQAHVDADGKVRVVVAHTDPGVPNWLDTEGRPVGMAVYRYVGARHEAGADRARRPARRGRAPRCPPTTRSSTPTRAARQLADRSRAAQRRWS